MSDRVPLDERLHERDLEAAIVLSLLNPEAGLKQSSQGVCWMCNLSFNSFLLFVCENECFYIYPGVAQARVVVDENTDPASLNLSNCCVDGAKLGKCFLFLVLVAHLFMHIFI